MDSKHVTYSVDSANCEFLNCDKEFDSLPIDSSRTFGSFHWSMVVISLAKENSESFSMAGKPLGILFSKLQVTTFELIMA